ncbi:MAG: hypothetical protein QM820_59455 [Minicystis sp.]
MTPELDPDIQALRKATRRPLWIGLGVAVATVIVCGLWVMAGTAATRRKLEAGGHTEVEVTIKAPFEYGYTSKKGAMSCLGTVTRLPFSTSVSESCYGTTPKPRPARPDNEVVAEALRTGNPSLPIAGARCPTIEAGATELTCTLESDAGAPLEVVMKKDGGAWKVESPTFIVSRATLADQVADQLRQKADAQVAVDCGAGLFGYAGGEHLICSATRPRAKRTGRVEITFAADGPYTWKATGL